MLNHEPLRLADGEYRFACLVWDNEPLPSGQLVALAAEDGSLPRFVAAFLNSKPISDAEAAEIRALLDAARYKEE